MNEILTVLEPWYPAIGAFCFFTLVRYIYKYLVLKVLYKIADKINFQHAQDLLSAFETPINVILFIVGIYTALNISPLANKFSVVIIDHILRTCIIYTFFWGMYNASSAGHSFMLDMLERFGVKQDDTISNIFSTIARFLIVLVGFAMVCHEWNYDISAFIASLSIGSLAVAFAAKDALANVFGSLIIIVDKPFKKGDWVLANGIEGIVENVSFRSTCIRTMPQELVYIPNSLLSNTPITNFTARNKRRLQFSIGLMYNTTAEQMEKVVAHIKTYLQSNPKIYPEDARANFTTFNDSSLDIQITCYARVSEQPDYLNVLEEVNLAIMNILEEEGVSCAYPSQSIYFETPLETKSAMPVVQPVIREKEAVTHK